MAASDLMAGSLRIVAKTSVFGPFVADVTFLFPFEVVWAKPELSSF
jgi:hypothetical protein